MSGDMSGVHTRQRKLHFVAERAYGLNYKLHSYILMANFGFFRHNVLLFTLVLEKLTLNSLGMDPAWRWSHADKKYKPVLRY
jgi:hypothetical protein